MKPYLCLILSVALLLCCVGCKSENREIIDPVSFYYRVRTDNQERVSSMIDYEIRETTGFSDDMIGLLNVYLQGPESSAFISPFPADVFVVSYETDHANVVITLCSEFSQLSGVNLSIACACITMTVSELTNCEQVSIIAEDALLDGSNMITMHRNDLLLFDTAE